MTTTRRTFDPEPDAPYGKCRTCGLSLSTESDGQAHMDETMQEARKTGDSRSHAISRLNPTREQRLESAVDDVVSSAIDNAMDDLSRLVDRGDATEEEIRKALRMQGEFQDAWVEYTEGEDR